MNAVSMRLLVLRVSFGHDHANQIPVSVNGAHHRGFAGLSLGLVLIDPGGRVRMAYNG